MNKFLRSWWAVIALVACTLVSAKAAPAILQAFPCNQVCTSSVSLSPASGICVAGGPGDCGLIGMKVTVQQTSGQCHPSGGGCGGSCTFLVTLDYGTSGTCNCTTVAGTECGTNFSFNCLPACGGPCFLQTNTDTVACGSSCNLSYTVSDTGSSSSCNVSGTLKCGSQPCP